MKLALDSKCNEIIIYCKHDKPRNLQEALIANFFGIKTPLYGIKYICCNEVPSGVGLRAATTDLHARWIVTTNVAFQLSDSISGGTKSQTITRIKDRDFREAQVKSWIDGDHGLEVVTDVVYLNN